MMDVHLRETIEVGFGADYLVPPVRTDVSCTGVDVQDASTN